MHPKYDFLLLIFLSRFWENEQLRQSNYFKNTFAHRQLFLFNISVHRGNTYSTLRTNSLGCSEIHGTYYHGAIT